MFNRFLEHYSQELAALRHKAADFAAAYPKIAGRLRLSRETSDDPHVERLIQSFAFSAARIRQKLEDGLPVLSQSILEATYPHYLAPLPAMSIVTMETDPALERATPLAAGTEMRSGPIDGDVCRFRTTQDITLVPLKIDTVRLMARPIEAPRVEEFKASGCLRITLVPTGTVPIHAMGIERLRFYISAGERASVEVQALLQTKTTGIVVAAHSADPDAQVLPRTALRQSGMTPEEGLMPYPPTSFVGYRLLTEFFTLPQKFRFFEVDLANLTQTNRLDLYFFIEQAPEQLEKQINADNLVLNAVPIVNLFEKQAEPIAVTGERSEYALQADSRRPRTQSVHSVRAVVLSDALGNAHPIEPIFRRKAGGGDLPVHWQLNRLTDGESDVRGATNLALVDHHDQPHAADDIVASATVLVLNGDLPNRLPFGGENPKLTMTRGLDVVRGIRCLMPFTETRWRTAPEDRSWRMISHLTLNHLSVTQDGVTALRNILLLYDGDREASTIKDINAIADVTSAPDVARIDGHMVRGTKVELTFDEGLIDAPQAWMLAAVVDRFLGAWTTLNSFTRLIVRLTGVSDPIANFPPRAGQETLI